MGSFGPTSATVAGDIRADGGIFYSEIFTFNGGGTQDVFTVPNSQMYLVTTRLDNYGGTDDRHGGLYLVGNAGNSRPVLVQLILELDSTGLLSLKSGTTNVLEYTAGGGNPYTQIYFLRIA